MSLVSGAWMAWGRRDCNWGKAAYFHCGRNLAARNGRLRAASWSLTSPGLLVSSMDRVGGGRHETIAGCFAIVVSRSLGREDVFSSLSALQRRGKLGSDSAPGTLHPTPLRTDSTRPTRVAVQHATTQIVGNEIYKITESSNKLMATRANLANVRVTYSSPVGASECRQIICRCSLRIISILWCKE